MFFYTRSTPFCPLCPLLFTVVLDNTIFNFQFTQFTQFTQFEQGLFQYSSATDSADRR